jgi:hypothetical protein
VLAAVAALLRRQPARGHASVVDGHEETRRVENGRGVPWARIGEFVGQRNLSVTADVYSHVLGDETELDYEAMLR